MRTLPLLGLLLLASTAQAQKIAPGLWEHAATIKSSDAKVQADLARAQAQMANLPPEQRKMVEQMMASRGVGLSGGAGKPTTVRICVTPEQAARDELPQGDGRCKTTQQQRSGNTLKFAFVCEGEQASRGEGQYTFTSDKAYSGTTTIDSVRKGEPQRMTVDMQGTWLAADCGEVKPRQRAKP